MGDLEKAVEKYIGNEKVIFRGEYELEGIKTVDGEADAAVFVNTLDEDALETLNPGGKLLIAVPNRDWYVKHSEGKDWYKEGDDYVLVEWKFDFDKNILWRKIVIPGKIEKEEELETFTPAHLKVLLETYGLRTKAIFSDVDKREYSVGKSILFGLAEKEKRAKKRRKKVVEKPVEEVKKEEVVEEVPEAQVEEVAVEEVEEEEEVEEVPIEETPVEEEIVEGYNLKLAWVDSNSRNKEMEVDTDIIIGRGREDVLTLRTIRGKRKYTPMMILDTKKRVSRKHMEIINSEGTWLLRDVGSTNGTKLNGMPLPGWEKPHGGNRFPSDYVELRDGDVITLANSIDLKVVMVPRKVPREVPKKVKREEVIPQKPVEKSIPKEKVVAEVFGEPETATPKREIREKPPAIREKTPEIVEKSCVLKWIDGNLRPHEVEITDDVYIGKRKDNNVVFLKTMDGKITIPLGIIDTENEINERHLEIHKENGKWMIKDLGSRNGTLLNGEYLPGWKRNKESEYTEVKNDDEVLVGKYLITIKIE